jgi:hypothetical protein
MYTEQNLYIANNEEVLFYGLYIQCWQALR